MLSEGVAVFSEFSTSVNKIDPLIFEVRSNSMTMECDSNIKNRFSFQLHYWRYIKLGKNSITITRRLQH